MTTRRIGKAVTWCMIATSLIGCTAGKSCTEIIPESSNTTIMETEATTKAVPHVPVRVDWSIPRGDLYSYAWTRTQSEAVREASYRAITDKEEAMVDNAKKCMAKINKLVLYNENGWSVVDTLAKIVTAEIGGLTDESAFSSARMEYAAVVWCILNRAEGHISADTNWGSEIIRQATAPNQFAYYPSLLASEEAYAVAMDVLIRWCMEMYDVTDDVGRVLPANYTYFTGDTRHNNFTAEWQTRECWDWSYEDPYITH